MMERERAGWFFHLARLVELKALLPHVSRVKLGCAHIDVMQHWRTGLLLLTIGIIAFSVVSVTFAR